MDRAEAMNAIRSSVEYYPRGYGYRIEAGEGAERIKQRGSDLLNTHKNGFERVVDEFRGWDASGLEIASTLVYSDREAASPGRVSD